MNWDFQLGNAARRAFRTMPTRDRERINRALIEMKSDPLSGDIVSLRGEYEGLFRRRVGSWRIFFRMKPDVQMVLITDIRRRTSTTY